MANAWECGCELLYVQPHYPGNMLQIQLIDMYMLHSDWVNSWLRSEGLSSAVGAWRAQEEPSGAGALAVPRFCGWLDAEGLLVTHFRFVRDASAIHVEKRNANLELVHEECKAPRLTRAIGVYT